MRKSAEHYSLSWRSSAAWQFGVRPYSLGAYGITKRDLEPIFEEYLAMFDVQREGI
jgi:hypothetical protein